jgi:hypothetical protein
MCSGRSNAETLSGKRDRAMVCLLLACGLRRHEVVGCGYTATLMSGFPTALFFDRNVRHPGLKLRLEGTQPLAVIEIPNISEMSEVERYVRF